MALFVLGKCKKHNKQEEMVIYKIKEGNTLGCFPACRKCMKEDDRYCVYNTWKEALDEKFLM